jgi:hypothetical protein
LEEVIITALKNFKFKIDHYPDPYLEALTAATRMSKLWNN